MCSCLLLLSVLLPGVATSLSHLTSSPPCQSFFLAWVALPGLISPPSRKPSLLVLAVLVLSGHQCRPVSRATELMSHLNATDVGPSGEMVTSKLLEDNVCVGHSAMPSTCHNLSPLGLGLIIWPSGVWLFVLTHSMRRALCLSLENPETMAAKSPVL